MAGEVDGSIIIGTEIDTSGIDTGLSEATQKVQQAASAIGEAFSTAAEQAQMGLAANLAMIQELTMAYERFAAQAGALSGAGAGTGTGEEGGQPGLSGAIGTMLDSALQGALLKAVELNFGQVGGQIDQNMAAGLATAQQTPQAAEQLVAQTHAATTSAVAGQGFQEPGAQMDQAMAEGVLSETGTLTGAVESAVGQAQGAAQSAVAGADFQGIGRSIAEGMAQGVMSGAGALASAVEAMVSMALAAARTALDAHSPSRAYEALGNDSIDGYLKPFQTRTRQAGDSIGDAMEALLHSASAQSAKMVSGNPTGQEAAQAAGDTVRIGEISIRTEQLNDTLDIREVGRQLGEAVRWEKRYRGVF